MLANNRTPLLLRLPLPRRLPRRRPPRLLPPPPLLLLLLLPLLRNLFCRRAAKDAP